MFVSLSPISLSVPKSMPVSLCERRKFASKSTIICDIKGNGFQGKKYRYNEKQSMYRDYLDAKKNQMVIAVGPSGTGKTSIACSMSLERLVNREISKIIITRPTVSTGTEMGFLPGTVENKMEPWLAPLYDNFVDEIDRESLQTYIKNNSIEICPLSFIRGRTFSSCWIIADEMQNSTPMEMKTLLTRVGENTKIIVTGDIEQCDLKINGGKNGLEDLLEKVEKKGKSKYAKIVTFSIDDVQRSDFVKYILKMYD